MVLGEKTNEETDESRRLDQIERKTKPKRTTEKGHDAARDHRNGRKHEQRFSEGVHSVNPGERAVQPRFDTAHKNTSFLFHITSDI